VSQSFCLAERSDQSRFRGAGRDQDEAIAGVVDCAGFRVREEFAPEARQGWS
jgi:hypothetical protein